MHGISSSHQQLLTLDGFVLVTEFWFSFSSHSRPTGVLSWEKRPVIRGRKNTSSKWVLAPRIQRAAAAWGVQRHLLSWVPALDHHKVQAQLITACIKSLGKHPGSPHALTHFCEGSPLRGREPWRELLRFTWAGDVNPLLRSGPNPHLGCIPFLLRCCSPSLLPALHPDFS